MRCNPAPKSCNIPNCPVFPLRLGRYIQVRDFVTGEKKLEFPDCDNSSVDFVIVV